MPTREPLVKLGYAEYCLFPNDGNRHEIIHGRHYMNPAPSPDHQTVSKYLQHYLFTQIELPGLGKVFDAPIDVQLGDFDIVQPDLLIVLNHSKAKITRTRIQGPPDLVVEILSPSTTKNDMNLKRRLYEQSGIREYWIVDSRKRIVDQLVLLQTRYQKLPPVKQDLKLSILPSIVIPLKEIWGR